jgi:hypothetical protein
MRFCLAKNRYGDCSRLSCGAGDMQLGPDAVRRHSLARGLGPFRQWRELSAIEKGLHNQGLLTAADRDVVSQHPCPAFSG